jgi:glycosyltransferase involved in cell wall biosynthesis
MNQCEALSERGHDTLLIGGAHGFPAGPTSLRGTPVRLFQTRRFGRPNTMTYLASPTMLRWLDQHVADFDVVHIHLARDGITLPAAALARRRNIPYVLQTHGMVVPKESPLHKIVDAVATVRVLRDAHSLFALSNEEQHILTTVVGSDRRIDVLPNGIPEAAAHVGRAGASNREFLFLARLHPRKRAVDFARAAVQLLSAGAEATFTLVGPDEGEGPAVTSIISGFAERHPDAADALQWVGPVAPDKSAAKLADAYVYVLPSVNEPFPMSLIEAMAEGRPVIVTESNGLADVVKEYDCGIVIPNESTEALADAMRRLLAAPEVAEQMGMRSLEAVRQRFSMNHVAEILERSYRSSTSDQRSLQEKEDRQHD